MAASVTIIGLLVLAFLAVVGHRLAVACDRQQKTMDLMIKAIRQTGYAVPMAEHPLSNGGVRKPLSTDSSPTGELLGSGVLCVCRRRTFEV